MFRNSVDNLLHPTLIGQAFHLAPTKHIHVNVANGDGIRCTLNSNQWGNQSRSQISKSWLQHDCYDHAKQSSAIVVINTDITFQRSDRFKAFFSL